ncbi:hypothetical protein B0F90DRAFT_1391770 [Multifurca ochricompacta]|uniref:DUF6534 domain-containing protein n=1 Tax=Multifurca ochricompacta TaxID=376703 RepID=A0AAD4QIZ4_9AGAM|nr:hypothetical protein B0F90DRAFT_368524 [Multifurca ochricompacta]KAI0293664.1 hypothetical protein B0F90DRAFT_1391770 [Multifurca ochricompacta]
MSSEYNTTLPAINPSEKFLPLVGPILVGASLSWWLYGIMVLQVYVYYLAFPGDPLWTKAAVYGLFVLDTIDSVITTDVAWKMLCRGWGKPETLIKTDWGFAMTPVIDATIPIWVHMFYAWRLWVLGRNMKWKCFTSGIVILSLAVGITGIASGITYATINDVRKITEIYVPISTWLAGSAFVDLLIATSMVYLLLAARKQAVKWNRATGRKLTNMIRLSVESGVASAALAIIHLTFFLSSGTNNIHLAFAFVTPKLYSNSLMVSLNSRAGVYERAGSSSSNPANGNARQVTLVEFCETVPATVSSGTGRSGHSDIVNNIKGSTLAV